MTEEVKGEVKTEVIKTTLEQLPFHELKRALKEKEISFKTSDKKDDLVKMLRTGETIHKPKEAKRMPNLGEKKPEKHIPMIPVEIKPQLEELEKRGLTWVINEDSGSVTFSRDIKTCANLDQSAINILRTAQQAFAARLGGLAPSIDSGNSIQARRIDDGK